VDFDFDLNYRCIWWKWEFAVVWFKATRDCL